MTITCPRCSLTVTELHALEPEMLSQLQAAGEEISGPICAGCASDLRKILSQSKGGVLFAQEKAKEKYRLELWKNRVSMIKQARAYMSAKNYAQAAVSYEKYLKVLDIVFGLKKGESLNPSHFKDSARTTEITVVTSVYWDLFRIYDTNEKYHDRQQQAARQLASFLQYSPMYPDIIKKAEAFVKSAKNPHIVKGFLKLASQERPRCFIATASFQNEFCQEVVFLRLFRDYQLNTTRWGRVFIKLYYLLSPPLAGILDTSPKLRSLSRKLLIALIKRIRMIY
ncbi:MAG: hypothetical protein HUU56_05675 [Bdellovibrionaceae bacterium]|nr:hypothetical protein [Pseudobdellovibrionaceae bacterium]